MPEPFERLGAAIRAARRKRGWSQKTLADRLVAVSPGVDSLHQVTVSAWERGVHLPRIECRPALRRLLGPEVARLLDAAERAADGRVGEQSPGHQRAATVSHAPEEDATNRARFLYGMATATGMALTVAVEPLLRSLGDEAVELFNVSAGDRLGSAHVRVVGLALGELERLDAARGGGVAYPQAAGLIGRVDGWLRDGVYPAHVGDALRNAAGDLEAAAAWLAFDAGRPAVACRHYQQALLTARVLDDPLLETRVLTQMSLILTGQDRPRDAVDLARAAQRIAAGWATPRLKALVRLRAMLAYAAMKDVSGCRRELARAQQLFERGPHDDDPLFTKFLTEAEVKGLEAAAYERRGLPQRAAVLYQEAIDLTEAHRGRNKALYTVDLAKALLGQGDAAAAAAVGGQVIPAACAMGSGRIASRLAELRSGIARTSNEPLAREFIEHYDCAFAGRPFLR